MKFEIHSVKEVIKNKSEVPATITETAMEQAEFDELPDLNSSTVEDFLTEKINEGLTFEQLQGEADVLNEKVKEVFDKVKEVNESIEWDSIVSEEDINTVKSQVLNRAKELDDTVEIDISNTEINFTDSLGVSSAGESITIAKLQIVRKAMDYMKVFPDADMSEVLRTLTLTTVAHELGHVVDMELGIYNNRIPTDETWSGAENRSERFAEHFAETVDLEGVDRDIRKQEKLIGVKKVKDFWEVVRKFNEENHDVGMVELFEIVSDEEAEDFMNARKLFYGVNNPENYALPYSKEELMDVV